MESTIRLFKAVPIKTKRKKINKELLEKTIKKGFIFSPEVVYNYTNYNELIGLVEKTIGITAEELNSSFHKSWKKVKEADIELLVMEQLIHYLTTYGFKEMGIYNKDSVYIPSEKLEIPDIDIENLKLVVIKGYTKEELKVKLLDLLNSGIALKEETMDDVLDVSTFLELGEEEIKEIKNKEVKVALYDYLNLVPEAPVEFLRYIVYKAVDKTLLIKSPELIAEIKDQKNLNIVKLFRDYDKEHGLDRLAEIFYRFKPLFLAFRTNQKLKIIINKLRRLAVKYHKPMQEDYLNSITSKIKKGEKIEVKRLKDELEKVNVFRKIRLSYALKFRTKDAESILYKIRNGKGYATKFSFIKRGKIKEILKIVLDSIANDVSKNVKGKKIYIPDHITYSLPATEKQFTGNFPSGTFVSIPKDMIVGINWKNINERSIDLDLSIIDSSGKKTGWDASYRSEDRSILFSGDITDAPSPKGATELFYVKRQRKESFIIFVNYYNYDADTEVPFKIIVAQEEPKSFIKNYMVDPNNLVSVASTQINKHEKILGLIVTTTNESRFYFAETYLGRSISSSGSDFVDNSRQYLLDFYENTISLEDILVKAGAKIVTDNKKKFDINLSPEELEKDTILNLVK